MFSTIIIPIAVGNSEKAVITNWHMKVEKRNICTPMARGTSGGKTQLVGKNACPNDMDKNKFNTSAIIKPGAPINPLLIADCNFPTDLCCSSAVGLGKGDSSLSIMNELSPSSLSASKLMDLFSFFSSPTLGLKDLLLLAQSFLSSGVPPQYFPSSMVPSRMWGSDVFNK